ncbi:MlaD family protein [Rhodococcus yananensis]|uniref:MlaD family protein n=1 Tax=Rhodococcus yananensis TaxID=2879464 RepID=UPI001CF87080|nr:MCE family protein [Rhodococcus yananensis]
MDRPSARRKRAYAVRGALSLALALTVAVGMVLRGAGTFDSTDDVFVDLPAEVGLVGAGAPVRYHGVDIGQIASIDAGAVESSVRLAIDTAAAPHVPASVRARVVPRTFFGDVYVELVDVPGSAAGTSRPASGRSLREVDTVVADTGPEAVAMYDLFTRMADVLGEMRPEQLTVALSALGSALDGNGETIGRTIDRLSVIDDRLAPVVSEFIGSTAQFADVLESLSTATPDIVGTVASAAEVSAAIVRNRDRLADAFGAAGLLAASVDGFTGPRHDATITVIDSLGTILATTAANPSGLYDTLANAGSFGAAGTRVFSSGRFDITAVPSFADPLPYTSADCPSYGTLTGAFCNSSGNGTYAQPVPTVIGGAAETVPLALLQQEITGADTPEPTAAGIEDGAGPPTDAESALGAAVSIVLGPLVRGSEVRIP